MKKTQFLAAVLAALNAIPAFATDAPTAIAASYSITGNVGFTSDYVFNGISQNFRTPALQGGFDFVHTNGLYLGTWASNISGNQYTNASMEWDIYAGYNGKINDDLTYNAGLLSVMYPGGKAYTSTIDTYKKWDTTSAVVGATWKGVNVKYTYAINDWYGISTDGFSPMMADGVNSTANDPANSSSKGSGYIEMNYSYEIADKLVASAHAGHQKINNFDALSYSDIKVGITREISGFVVGAAYTKTNATDNTLYHVVINGEDKVLSGSILALSVTRSF